MALQNIASAYTNKRLSIISIPPVHTILVHAFFNLVSLPYIFTNSRFLSIPRASTNADSLNTQIRKQVAVFTALPCLFLESFGSKHAYLEQFDYRLNFSRFPDIILSRNPTC